MTYEAFKTTMIDLLRADRIEDAIDLSEAYPDYDERWENEPLPAGTWMTI